MPDSPCMPCTVEDQWQMTFVQLQPVEKPVLENLQRITRVVVILHPSITAKKNDVVKRNQVWFLTFAHGTHTNNLKQTLRCPISAGNNNSFKSDHTPSVLRYWQLIQGARATRSLCDMPTLICSSVHADHKFHNQAINSWIHGIDCTCSNQCIPHACHDARMEKKWPFDQYSTHCFGQV